MCGIAGMQLRDRQCDQQAVVHMCDIIAHRGPDDSGVFCDRNVGLGHRRLSIIDLSGGHQPMATTDGRWVLVYNGEIYNYKELRSELEDTGVTFRTSSDTEVILHLHAILGDSAVSRLNGMFAYAIWDRDKGRLLLARDRAGIKPLYYAQAAGGVCFASEVKALFASGLVHPEINKCRVGEYLLFRQVAGQDNLFQGVKSVPPGHVLEIVDGRPSSPAAFWTYEAEPPAFSGTYVEAVAEADRELTAAVSRQLMADVPVGTFCSGGLDSSLITALAAREAGSRLKTFSVGFEQQAYDESQFARNVSQHCGTDHHELRISQDRFAELLPRLIWHHDLPLNFANSIHIFALSELARRHVKVVLTGEGADELFGGYPRYALAAAAGWFRRLPKPGRRSVRWVFQASHDRRLERLGTLVEVGAAEAVMLNCGTISVGTVEAIIRTEARPDLELRRLWSGEALSRGRDVLAAVSELDFRTYLVSILNRQDKMSMAVGLESRVPFLDNEVIDLSRSLPQQYKQTLFARKRVIQDVARKYLPAEVIDRRKSGFGVPLTEWFRESGAVVRALEGVLSDGVLNDVVNPQAVRGLMIQHREARADHGELLWGLLNLGLWRDCFRC